MSCSRSSSSKRAGVLILVLAFACLGTSLGSHERSPTSASAFLATALPKVSAAEALNARARRAASASAFALKGLRRNAISVGEGAAQETHTQSQAKKTAIVAAREKLLDTARIGVYFFFWYLFNVYFNIFNKRALNSVNKALPYTISTIQLFVGMLYFIPLWLFRLRATPNLSKERLQGLAKIAAFHAMGHLSATLSLNAGAVSFTHIVKAAEPFFATVLSALVLGSYFPLPVYLTLIPIVGGVILASLKELTFSWVGFIGAMGSNLGLSTRAILSKQIMAPGKVSKSENLSPANIYAVLTILSFFMQLPLALFMEGGKISSVLKTAVDAGTPLKEIFRLSFMSGLFYYLYNEVAFLALDKVHPITHAVGNTIKRVVIIVAAVLVFKDPMSLRGMVGSSIAISGVLLYSLTKQYYQSKPSETKTAVLPQTKAASN